ncbi:MAG: hypothetical protein KF781_02475 [Chitinophagaceae bacterium]|nr:hypothetical protein [Chitinophagaceae bacterium]MCW5904375.1 hypothetical protein [Chitinophagaceae bacterium]
MNDNIEEYKDRRRKSYVMMRMIYDLGMATLLLAMGVVMLFGKYFGLEKFIQLDNMLRNIFGIVCLLYGAFRLYRGIKRDY